jgi:hypothetical protein
MRSLLGGRETAGLGPDLETTRVFMAGADTKSSKSSKSDDG